MELKNGMYVITPKGCRPWLTKGKKYQVFNVYETNNNYKYDFHIIDDDGDDIYCLLKQCNNLNNQDWIIYKPNFFERILNFFKL